MERYTVKFEKYTGLAGPVLYAIALWLIVNRLQYSAKNTVDSKFSSDF